MLWWIGQSLVSAALLAGVVWIVWHTTRIGPAVRHALWLVVRIKLLTPPLVVWPWGVADLLAKVDRQQVQPLIAARITTVTPIESKLPVPIAPPMVDSSITANVEVPSVLKVAPIETREAQTQVDRQAVPIRTRLERCLQVGAIVWIVGTFAFALVQAARIVRIVRRLRGAQAPHAAVIEQMNVLSKRLHIRPIEARVVRGVGSAHACVARRVADDAATRRHERADRS